MAGYGACLSSSSRAGPCVGCVLQDGRGWTGGETVRVPAPNVPTGPVPVSADPRTRPLLSTALTGRSHVAEHPGVVLSPAHHNVRTNKELGNIQPSNSGKHWPVTISSDTNDNEWFFLTLKVQVIDKY